MCIIIMCNVCIVQPVIYMCVCVCNVMCVCRHICVMCQHVCVNNDFNEYVCDVWPLCMCVCAMAVCVKAQMK
jgi:hypothetical protein